MKYLLDTNTWVAYLRRTSPTVIQRIRETAPTEIALCSVVIAELRYGAYRSSDVGHNLGLVDRLIERFDCITFDAASADHHARIRLELSKKGTPIGPHDLMIAACAAAHGLIVVSNNTREFGRVSGLQIEDWTLAR